MLTCAEDTFSESLVTMCVSCLVHRFDPGGGQMMIMSELHLHSSELSLVVIMGF
jgi:hypothetical protein